MPNLFHRGLRRLRDLRRALLPDVPGLRLRDHPRLLALFERLLQATSGTYLDDVQGHRMHLNPLDAYALSFKGVHEPSETRLVKERVKEGQVVLDLGAQIGYFTLLFARRVGPSGRVIAVEPDPTNFQILRRNVELNGYANVDLVNKAAARHTGPARLYLSDGNAGDHRTSATSGARRSIEIDAVRLDEHLAELDRVDFVKIDIQGAEIDALEGMRELLARSPDVVLLVEFWPAGLVEAGVEPRRLLELLDELGFTYRDIEASHEDAEALLDAYPVAGGRHTNLLLTRPAPRLC